MAHRDQNSAKGDKLQTESTVCMHDELPRASLTSVCCEQSICRTLDDMGVWHEEKFLQNMTSAIALRDKVAIHPEGPTCYCSSWPKRPLGETLAVRRTLTRHGWTVVPLAKHEWMALASHKRAAYLTKLLDDVGAG